MEGINYNYNIEPIDKKFVIEIFGQKIDCNNTIDWHKDYKSGYIYPYQRFDKIETGNIYNKGIDIIFPWELSRFEFGIDLALCYHQSNDTKYYCLFKNLVIDWLDKNPFLIGINWFSTMDVAIRAVNWIVTINMFGNIFWEDKNFVIWISKSLYNHARYIEKFPRKNRKGKGHNHLISNYSGLFILALSFINTNRSKRWLKIAKNGLELCIEYQIFKDGTDFEYSIPYHRLVLELLAVPAILGRSYNIEFSKVYYGKLFKMFEFVSAYIDSKGNAPQIGDNDSGRYVKLSYCEEQNHQYLLEFGQQIYEYKFEIEDNRKYLLPIFKNNINRIDLSEIGIKPRKCSKSIFFTDGGYYFLKNNNFSISVFCPLNNRRVGHRHFDSGSFTLSYKGIPIIVDSGTGVYTSNLQIRKQLRDYPSHNIYYRKKPNANNIGYFGIIVDLDVKVVSCSENLMIIRTNFENDLSVERKFILNERSLTIQDRITGNSQELLSAIHFADNWIGEIKDNRINNCGLEVIISGAKDVFKEKYLYSPSYSILEEKEKIVIIPNNTIKIDFNEINPTCL